MSGERQELLAIREHQGSHRVLMGPLFWFTMFLCIVFLFFVFCFFLFVVVVCLRPMSCVSSVACVSVLSIRDYHFGFL